MDHDEGYRIILEDKQLNWDPYLKMDCLSLAFVLAKLNKHVEQRKGFGMKESLLLHSLGWKILIMKEILGKNVERFTLILMIS